jgi:hypothetical protein
MVLLYTRNSVFRETCTRRLRISNFFTLVHDAHKSPILCNDIKLPNSHEMMAWGF